MFPLPQRPSFPVYGLGPHFDGLRWLIIWNDWERLHTVALGHGQPESGPWIAVSTYLKTAERRVDEHVTVGPGGFHDAVIDAVTCLAEMTHPNDSGASKALIDREGAAIWPDADYSTLGGHWMPDTMTVDDQPCQARTCYDDGAWATLIDLPEVSVAVNGPASMADQTGALVNVVENLDDYV